MSGAGSITATAPSVNRRVFDFCSLTKPRVTSLVLVTTGLGYLLATTSFDLFTLANTIIGTGLVAGAAAAFNQVWERDYDARMRRTQTRALPSGRIPVAASLVFAFVLAVAGTAELIVFVNLLSAALAAATLLLYVLVYTPMKRVSSLATVVGAVPGAIPPMIGWAAAAGRLDPGAWVLFGILFFWQMPHFLAIAWLYRDDYRRAGYPMLPVLESDGGATGRQSAIYAALLLPVSLALSALRVTGWLYFAGAAVAGIAFLAAALTFALHRSVRHARLLFFTSIFYLPVLLALAFLDRLL